MNTEPTAQFRDPVLARFLHPETAHSALEATHFEMMAASADRWSRWLQDVLNEDAVCREFLQQAVGREVLQRLPQAFLRWVHRAVAESPNAPVMGDELLESTAQLYARWGEYRVPRHDWLTVLATDGSSGALRRLSTIYVLDPPENAVAAAAPIASLFHSTRAEPEVMFPELLGALAHLQVAPAVLDLANFLTRRGRHAPHPAQDRVPQLIRLLEGLVAGLERIQRETNHGSEFGEQTQRQLSDSLSLAISLCDALALIGEKTAVPCLERVAVLQHRRLRVEALAALVRLGEDNAARELVALAAEPAVRMRVLAYLEELQLEEQVDEEHRSPEAVAESELVAHLSSPGKLGVPPSQCELIDARTLYWPGYEEPRSCYLFRYTYRVAAAPDPAAPDRPAGRHTYSNIGIAGPLVQALQVDLCDLPVDDIYAVYAGSDAEHEELYETPWHATTEQDQAACARWFAELEQENYDDVSPLLMGHFFGDEVLVARAAYEGVLGTVVVDDQGISWHPQLASRFALGPSDYYQLYKGRRLLRAFNNDL